MSDVTSQRGNIAVDFFICLLLFLFLLWWKWHVYQILRMLTRIDHGKHEANSYSQLLTNCFEVNYFI